MTQAAIPGLDRQLTPQQALVHVRAEDRTRCRICGLGADLCTGALPEEITRAEDFIRTYAVLAKSPGGRKQGWSFAVSMPDSPHEYAVRERCQLVDGTLPEHLIGKSKPGFRPHFDGEVEREFEWFVMVIRQRGYDGKHGRTKYRYMNVADDDGIVWRYWTMGNPLGETTIINRTPVQPDEQAKLRAANVGRR